MSNAAPITTILLIQKYHSCRPLLTQSSTFYVCIYIYVYIYMYSLTQWQNLALFYRERGWEKERASCFPPPYIPAHQNHSVNYQQFIVLKRLSLKELQSEYHQLELTLSVCPSVIVCVCVCLCVAFFSSFSHNSLSLQSSSKYIFFFCEQLFF